MLTHLKSACNPFFFTTQYDLLQDQNVHLSEGTFFTFVEHELMTDFRKKIEIQKIAFSKIISVIFFQSKGI